MSWAFWTAVAVGVAVGGAVGFLAVRNIGTTTNALAARVFVFLFFAAGSAVAAPYIAEGLFGGVFPELPVEEEISQKLRDSPMLARVFRDFPDIEKNLRERGGKAYREGGDDALAIELERASQEIGVFARSYYLPRAQDADLLRFTTETIKVLQELAKKDPVLCELWISPDAGGEFVLLSDIAATIGEVPVAQYEQAATEAIANASVAVPDYDKSRADAIHTAVGQDIIVRQGLRALEMLGGRREVKTADDARKVCQTAAQMFERITQYRREDSVAALRDFMLVMSNKGKPKPSE